MSVQGTKYGNGHVQYTADSLDDVAKMFMEHAARAENAEKHASTQREKGLLKREATTWTAAAEMILRTKVLA